MEYEYSFNVNNIDAYIDYCRNNNYDDLGITKQERTIYRNSNGAIARITIETGKEIVKKLDFKENKMSETDLTIRKESKSIKFDNEENCENILNFLEYKKDNTLVRERYNFSNGIVKFEIDNYIEPKAMVVALEGEKEAVDKVYYELEKSLNLKYKIKND